MDSLFIRVMRQWVPLTVAISAVCFIIYVVIQQDIRSGANDPQIQMAEDLAVVLNTGVAPTLAGKIDVSKSLAPFIIVYDLHGNVLNSSASLNGKTPELPNGVLTSSKGTEQTGENRVTWQPQEGVRLASVIVAYDKGYVLVGRNMREIEIRSSQQFNRILFGWVFSLVATLFCVTVMQALFKKKLIKSSRRNSK